MNNSFRKIVARLRAEYPGVKLLALGQTIYWDEPMKATLRRLLDEQYPEAVMVVGIHDADYFSKVPATADLPHGWHILPHNDGSTRDLWVATGEISQLFGSETLPSRDLMVSYGVQIDKIAREFPGGRDALVDTATEAWGWRGLAHIDSGNEVSCCVPLRDAMPSLLALLEWGFIRTLDTLSDVDAIRGKRLSEEFLAEVRAYAAAHPDASITDMFRDLLPGIYRRLLGHQPGNLELTQATEVFRFNASTSGLPRFRLLEAFLDPERRAACQEAYDLAVLGSDTYTLDRFPPGAIPFDLAIPGAGRGTICLRDGRIVIETDKPVSIPTLKPVTTTRELAELIEARFGQNVALVGKALTLVLMMASEYIFVLNEEASAYVPRCERMAALMKERGLNLGFYPILRIDYHTWDSFSSCNATLNLPGHMAAAFGHGETTSTEFSHSWRDVVKEHAEILEKIAGISGTENLLAFLASREPELWDRRIATYREAGAQIKDLSDHTEPLKSESVYLRDLSYRLKQDVQQLEVEKGVHFRNSVRPLKDELWRLESEGAADTQDAEELARQLHDQEEIRAGLEQRIAEKREEAANAHGRSLELKNTVKSLEKGEVAEKARASIKSIEYEAELARLWLVRDAVLVSKGLPYTDHRPSAWWFILVDPELQWFRRVSDTAEFRFEEIDS
jgi:hypothetical protein